MNVFRLIKNTPANFYKSFQNIFCSTKRFVDWFSMKYILQKWSGFWSMGYIWHRTQSYHDYRIPHDPPLHKHYWMDSWWCGTDPHSYLLCKLQLVNNQNSLCRLKCKKKLCYHIVWIWKKYLKSSISNQMQQNRVDQFWSLEKQKLRSTWMHPYMPKKS